VCAVVYVVCVVCAVVLLSTSLYKHLLRRSQHAALRRPADHSGTHCRLPYCTALLSNQHLALSLHLPYFVT
jgi:hypothetical protein